MKTTWITAAVLALGLATSAPAGEIGFEEDFALAKDRSVALKQLIPGTEDYYFYYCLQYQHAGQFEKVPELLKLWIDRHGRTGRVVEIENRQALLQYQKDPQAALNLIVNRLNLTFNHQRERLDEKPNLPTSLDGKLVGREAFTQRALELHPQTVDGFEDSALDWLIAQDLGAERRRNLLARLPRPDYTDLVRVVVDDLNSQYSGGFGSLPIHARLTLAQLEELLKLKPELLNQDNFVRVYLTKLQPPPDVDWKHDPKEHAAYLDRLAAFAARLAPVHNSLKAHVMYQRLVFDRAHGVYDPKRFMAYLALPRPMGYVNPDYLREPTRRDVQVNLAADYAPQTLLPPVGDDEPLVRSYLMHFFIEEKGYGPYEEFVRDTYLKDVFAETKIVNGIGDQEQWYSMIDPGRLQQLKERIDLDFAYANRTYFTADEAVAMDLNVKNVKSLIVKVYELNAMNFYRANLREMDTDVNLDGLVANEEKVHAYADPPQRRVPRHFEFPALKQRGVYVVEFIGNGKASRALVRKGKLQYLMRAGSAGHVFTILDESGKRAPTATLWLAGREYKPDKDGVITVPFSTAPARQAIILADGDFACLAHFDHQAENYALSAGVYVDREALLKRKPATVLVRPSLQVNGVPVSLSLLEDVRLLVTSSDGEGVQTTKDVPGFKLFEDKESSFDFQTPENVRRIQFVLKAKVQNLSLNKKLDLAVAQTFELNGIDATEKVEDLHLLRVDGKYVLEVLGKTGEARPDRPVSLNFKHRDVRDTITVSLQSDARGRIQLGELPEIAFFTAGNPEGTSRTFPMTRDEHSYPANIQGQSGQKVMLPYMGKAEKPDRGELALLEIRGGAVVADWFSGLRIENGMLVLEDLPPGDYDLTIKPIGKTIRVRLAPGEQREGYVLAENRHLKLANPLPLQIVSAQAGADAVTVQLRNTSKFTRVHVFATRYLPEYSAFALLGAIPLPEGEVIQRVKTDSAYLAGRNIGDEYRYILDRKYAPKLPGNMLTRPGLLLNPWAVSKTETGEQAVAAGEAYGAAGVGAAERRSQLMGVAGRPAAAVPLSANLDFLGQPAVVLANLRPDEKGVVTIARKDLGAHQQLHVVAVDPLNTAYRELSLAEAEMKFLDLRLPAALATDQHLTEQKRMTAVRKGDKFTLDTSTARLEVYDSLPRVYALYATLSNNATLAEFSFILDWPKLKPEERRQKYSKYACHELNYFLMQKDPEFFKAVIQPYLKNKKDKTFLDRFLIGEELSEYLKPWKFSQLNVVERALLAQKIAAEQAAMARHVKDRYDLIPPDIDRFNFLFKTALKGSALETAPALGRMVTYNGQRTETVLPIVSGTPIITDLAMATPPAPTAAREPKPTPTAAPAPQAALAEKEALESEGNSAGRKLERAAAAGEPGKPVVEHKRLADTDKDAKLQLSLQVPADEFRRREARQFFRRLDKTEEWAENNYYHLPIEQQTGGLVPVNAFWKDYAASGGKAGFLSVNLAEAGGSFTEIMFALAVLDLPFEAPKHETVMDGPRMTLTSGGNAILFHKEILAAKPPEEKTPILVSQNFFRHNDRYRFVNNERLDKYVSDEFLAHVVYGCQVVITNPTSSPQKLDVLLQVPRGALPVLNSLYTRGVYVQLAPYSTQTVEYYFYFPAAGEYEHYPVHVARNESLVGFAPPVVLKAVEKLSKLDITSWDYISQNGSGEEVLDYLKANNVDRTNLERIAWRMADAAYFRTVLDLLTSRHVYNHTLWSYGVKHNVPEAVREFLQNSDGFVAQCGPYLDSPLLRIDPVARKAYQHLEYAPLVNARAHRLGKARQIVNDRFFQQYQRLTAVLVHRPALDDEDRMSAVYYLLLQDRVEDAGPFFAAVDAAKLPEAIQYDYFKAYLDFYSDDPKLARGIAQKHRQEPVDRWRNLFVNVLAQLDEVEGKAAAAVDKEDRAQQQGQLASSEPSFDFVVESRKVVLKFQNLPECRVNYYLMDIELLFSTNPFVQQHTGHFAYIRPNATEVVKLPGKAAVHTFDLPAKFHSANVMVEIEAAGQKKSQAYYANSLAVQVVENYGQVKVAHEKTGKPLAKVYVKAYAQTKDGQVKFYKDGYTDLRGRFEYASLNTNELDNVAKFSLLVLSETDGAVVREASPPKQ